MAMRERERDIYSKTKEHAGGNLLARERVGMKIKGHSTGSLVARESQTKTKGHTLGNLGQKKS